MKSLFQVLKEDIKHYSQNQKGIRKLFALVYYQGLVALIIYRFLNSLFLISLNNKGFKVVYNFLFIVIYIPFKNTTGMELHPEASIGRKLYIPHGNSIVINKKAIIGDGVTIHQNTTVGINYRTEESPKIGDNVFISTNCSIIGGIHIGNNAIILSNSAVVQDVEENSIIGGVPAKLIKKIS